MPVNDQITSRSAQRQNFYLRRAAEHSRQGVAQLLHNLHGLVHRLESHDHKLNETKRSLDDLYKENSDESKLTLHRKSTLLAVLFGFLGVYGLDYLLVRAAADWLIGMGFYHLSVSVNNLLLLLVPALFIAVEIAISEHALEARDDVHITGNRGPWILWTIVSLVLAIVMPALGVATYLVKVNLTLHGQPLSTAHEIQLLGLCCLSLVAHVCMVFGGELSRDARAFLWFSIRGLRLRGKIRQHQAAYFRTRESVSRNYRDYLDGLDNHNTTHPDAVVAPGPFEKTVVKIVNELYPNAIIQAGTQTVTPSTAAQAQQTGRQRPDSQDTPGVAPPPEPERDTADGVAGGQPNGHQPNGHHQVDDDYFRRIVESQIRDAEGEVSD